MALGAAQGGHRAGDTVRLQAGGVAGVSSPETTMLPLGSPETGVSGARVRLRMRREPTSRMSAMRAVM